MTPFAQIEPVLLSGANISNVSLHNMDELKRLDIMVNDTVLVKRAGDVIPQIVKVNHDVRDAIVKPVDIPERAHPVIPNCIWMDPFSDVPMACHARSSYLDF